MFKRYAVPITMAVVLFAWLGFTLYQIGQRASAKAEQEPPRLSFTEEFAPESDAALCAGNMRAIWRAMNAYAQDNDQRLPVGDHPITGLAANYLSSEYLVCYADNPNVQSYGFNAMCAGYKLGTGTYEMLVPVLADSSQELWQPEQAAGCLRYVHQEYGIVGDKPMPKGTDPGIEIRGLPENVKVNVEVREAVVEPVNYHGQKLGANVMDLNGRIMIHHPLYMTKESTRGDQGGGEFVREDITRRLTRLK